MTKEETIERMAEAMWVASYPEEAMSWREAQDAPSEVLNRAHFRRMARAAFEAEHAGEEAAPRRSVQEWLHPQSAPTEAAPVSAENAQAEPTEAAPDADEDLQIAAWRAAERMAFVNADCSPSLQTLNEFRNAVVERVRAEERALIANRGAQYAALVLVVRREMQRNHPLAFPEIRAALRALDGERSSTRG